MDKEKVIYFFSWLTSVVINRFKNPGNHAYKNILVIRLDEIGDMMTSLPVFDALHAKFLGAKITVWCPPLTAQLLKHHPNIYKIVNQRKDLKDHYDLIIDLRGSFETITFALTHFPHYRLDRGTVRFKNKFSLPQHPHEIKVNFQILKPLLGDVNEIENKIYLSNDNLQVAEDYLKENNIKQFAMLHCFSMKKLKEWQPEKFADLAKILKEKYQLDIIFIGSKNEIPSISTIQKQIPFKTFVFAGFDLLDLAALSSKASLMTGNDSGPMHIAATMNIPVVGLFGPGEPHLFSPYGKKATYIHHKLKCNPCDQIHCKYPDNPCMHRITVEEVLEKIKTVI